MPRCSAGEHLAQPCGELVRHTGLAVLATEEAAVVAGDTATVAKGVELGLAMLIPPVIDFLASLVDLGDLPEKVAEIVKSLHSWVEGIVKALEAL